MLWFWPPNVQQQMQWCAVVLLTHFWAEKRGPLRTSSVQPGHQEEMLFSLSDCMHMCSSDGEWLTDRQDMVKCIPKFVTDLVGKNCMKMFPW